MSEDGSGKLKAKHMDISVILCTYNRCESLARALASVAAQDLDRSVLWEVLVVDNNSTDRTPEVVEAFRARFPGRFRYVREVRQGKSHALNSGIRETNGAIVAFMDDDVIVEPTWLSNLTKSFRDETWAGAGGRILPQWNCEPPSWIPMKEKHILAPLAVFDLGMKAGELQEPPFGTNMAFRRQVFEKYHGFRTDLGPQPGSEIRSEDTEFGRRLLAAGERLWYEPTAVVYHPVSEKRIRKEYFLQWRFDKSRADVLESGPTDKETWHFEGIPIYLFRRMAMWVPRWIMSIDSAERFSNKLKVWGIAGEISECRRLARKDYVAYKLQPLVHTSLPVESNSSAQKPAEIAR